MSGVSDYYAVLGLSPQADEVVAHAACKALLRKNHPPPQDGTEGDERAGR